MPIKLPKGFQRRKSSGNALDEVQVSEPSFKVFPRNQVSRSNSDMALQHDKPMPVSKNSFDEDEEDLFTVARPENANRGSGGTTTSLSNAPYHSGASSTRLSTSSTNPSSVDTRSDKNSQSAQQKPVGEPPVPPPHQPRSGGFLRNAGRTFSFGVKSIKEVPTETSPPSPPPPPVPAVKGRFSFSQGRERAMTTSSVSTATPPRLLESDLALGTSELDTFGNMFDGIGKSRELSPSRPSPVQAPPAYLNNQLHPSGYAGSKSAVARPSNANKFDHAESSPYSWTSETSRDGLMRSPSPPKTVTQNSPQTSTTKILPLNPRAGMHQGSHDTNEDNMFTDTPIRPRAYSRPAKQAGAPPSAYSSNERFNGTSGTIRNTAGERDEPAFDPTLLASAHLATQYQERKPTAVEMSNKIMTPAQFERYRQQHIDRHRVNRAFGKTDSDESGDDYEDEDEDETERDRQAAKQRRKQEAHLAVYRQTMIKITGDGAPAAGLANSTAGLQPPGAQNVTDFAKRLSSFTLDPKSSGKSSDEDEDDDVPLGILAAHGFPNKNRPPNMLTGSASNPNLRSLAQQQGPGSVAGESVNRGSLPAFARKLPEDPYFGAGLVNSSNRESLAQHSHSTPNLLASGASTAHPHHPAGLVGVIAGEERARAARRGSPNAQTGQYDLPQSMPMHPGMLRSQTMGQVPSMMMPGMPGMPPMLTPGDHAQIQMSQQMTQMMQMQMQWMQQMQQMMGQGQSMPQLPPMPQMSPSPLLAPQNMARPQSVPLQNYSGQGQRTMSTLNPSMAPWGSLGPNPNGRVQSTYAPSIAPSERSNIGLASRYRPVSTMNLEPEQPWQKRASTMTSNSFRPLSIVDSAAKQRGPIPSIRKPVVAVDDDDDDEQGWAEMKAKKDKKTKSWKLRKGQNALQELYNGTT